MNNALTWTYLAVSLIAAFQAIDAGAATTVRGQPRACRDFADIDWALDHPTSDYFKGWTSADFDAAQSWIRSCVSTPASTLDQHRLSSLATIRQQATDAGEIQKTEARQAERRELELLAQRQTDERHAQEAAALAKQAAAEERAQSVEMAARAARRECFNSPPFQRYLAGVHVVEALASERRGQARLNRERRVTELTNLENQPAKYSAGKEIVSAQDELADAWAQYSRLGGPAKAPQQVAAANPNPCP